MQNNNSDWNHAPVGAKYLAQNANGSWFFYFKKPKQLNGYWSVKKIKEIVFYKKNDFSPRWRETLQKRP